MPWFASTELINLILLTIFLHPLPCTSLPSETFNTANSMICWLGLNDFLPLAQKMTLGFASVQAAQRGATAQVEATDARQRLASDLRIAEAASARQARELADRERDVGMLRNKVMLDAPTLSRSRSSVTWSLKVTPPLSCASCISA